MFCRSIGSWDTYRRFAALLFLLAIFAASMLAQAPKNSGSLHGQVTDPAGAVVIGAAVSVTTPDGQSQKAVSDKLGNYVIHGLPAGRCHRQRHRRRLRSLPDAECHHPRRTGAATRYRPRHRGQQEQVTVQSETPTVDVNPANNASATILKGEDLEALSDDPDDLEQDLLALAGPSVGPNGGQIYIDGFSDGTLPPKSAIREIRINQNPFSAEI